jgi:hypothetical protein
LVLESLLIEVPIRRKNCRHLPASRAQSLFKKAHEADLSSSVRFCTSRFSTGEHTGSRYGMEIPMNMLWTVAGAVVVTCVVARAWWRSYAPEGNALGAVSEQWLAEHRLDRPDSQR